MSTERKIWRIFLHKKEIWSSYAPDRCVFPPLKAFLDGIMLKGEFYDMPPPAPAERRYFRSEYVPDELFTNPKIYDAPLSVFKWRVPHGTPARAISKSFYNVKRFKEYLRRTEMYYERDYEPVPRPKTPRRRELGEFERFQPLSRFVEKTCLDVVSREIGQLFIEDVLDHSAFLKDEWYRPWFSDYGDTEVYKAAADAVALRLPVYATSEYSPLNYWLDRVNKEYGWSLAVQPPSLAVTGYISVLFNRISKELGEYLLITHFDPAFVWGKRDGKNVPVGLKKNEALYKQMPRMLLEGWLLQNLLNTGNIEGVTATYEIVHCVFDTFNYILFSQNLIKQPEREDDLFLWNFIVDNLFSVPNFNKILTATP